MKQYANYIWDFDGTLFDSYPHSIAALCETATHFGIDHDPKAVAEAMHMTFKAAYKLLGVTEEHIRHFLALREDWNFQPPIVPYPHVKEALEHLISKGARHYLFTHSDYHMSVDFLKDFGMDHLFSGFVTADMEFPIKPAPDGILYILKEYGLDPNETVMVGDREIDILSGKNAGVDGILFDPDFRVQQTCADWRIEDFRTFMA